MSKVTLQRPVGVAWRSCGKGRVEGGAAGPREGPWALGGACEPRRHRPPSGDLGAPARQLPLGYSLASASTLWFPPFARLPLLGRSSSSTLGWSCAFRSQLRYLLREASRTTLSQVDSPPQAPTPHRHLFISSISIVLSGMLSLDSLPSAG